MAISVIPSVPNLAEFPKASNIFSPSEVELIGSYAEYIAKLARKQINYSVDSTIWIEPLVTFLANKNENFKIKPSSMLFYCDDVNDLLMENVVAHARADITTVSLSLNLLGIYSDKEIDSASLFNRMAFINAISISIADAMCPERGVLLSLKANSTAGSVEKSKELLKYFIVDSLLSNVEYMYKRNFHMFVSRFKKDTISIAMDVGLLNIRQVSTPVAKYNVFIEPVQPTTGNKNRKINNTRARRGA